VDAAGRWPPLLRVLCVSGRSRTSGARKHSGVGDTLYADRYRKKPVAVSAAGLATRVVLAAAVDAASKEPRMREALRGVKGASRSGTPHWKSNGSRETEVVPLLGTSDASARRARISNYEIASRRPASAL